MLASYTVSNKIRVKEPKMSNSSTQAPTAGQPIPTPPDFTIVWDDPRDAKLTWMNVPQYKTPISPLIHAVIGAFLVGGNAGFEGAGLPFQIRVERFNTYPYMGMVPKAAPPRSEEHTSELQSQTN